MCAMSPLNPMAMNHFGTLPGVHGFMPRPLRSHDPDFTSGLRTSAISDLKLKTHFNFPGAHDLLTSVHL
jgi:hypothetical protein